MEKAELKDEGNLRKRKQKAENELKVQQELLKKELENDNQDVTELPWIIQLVYNYVIFIISALQYYTGMTRNMVKIDRGKVFLNKVIIIGDDFAAGQGDQQEFYKVKGIATHLQLELMRLHEIRQTWQIYNLGVAHTTTKDWVPGTVNSRLDSVLKNKEYRDCKIAILMLGFNDCRFDYC